MRELKSGILLASLGAVLLVLTAPSAQAQWIEDGTALCTATGNQEYPASVSDGAGGALVTWEDSRGGGTSIYAQRVDAYGVVQWTTDGVIMCTSTGLVQAPTIISDGEGGAIVGWYDYRSGNADIYAQRVDASGAVQWTADGVALCTATGPQEFHTIVSDGAGGAIIAWDDYRSGSNYDVYAQCVDASGTVQWTADGVAMCTATGSQFYPKIVSDGAGGAIVTWYDIRSGSYDIYAQRVDASGTVQWTADGVAMCTATGNQVDPTIASDGAGGAIVTWYDVRGGSGDIYVQRVDVSGAVQWTADGVALCTATADQYKPRIVSDGSGGAIVTWYDSRSGTSNYDIYSQKVDASGAVQWTADGVATCTAAGQQQTPTISSDGVGGAIVTWEDSRGASTDIYVQRVDASGAAQWTTDGVATCTTTGQQQTPVIISDGEGGAIVTWSDDRSGSKDIYAQRMTRQGYNYWYAAPTITSIQDIPGDEGGRVWISFDASQLDTWSHQEISHYSIWRSLPPPYALAMAADGKVLDNQALATAEMLGNAFCFTAGGYWQFVATVDAYLRSGYGCPVTTLRDSTSFDDGREYFLVAAHGVDPMDYFDSAPDSGYSVDNLSPCPPAALAAEYIGGLDLYLHWNPNMEADLSHYAIYRETTPDFVPDETNRIGTTADSAFVDNDYGYVEYYYKVSAIDVHENESTFALLTPDMITSAPGENRRYDNVLFQNSPNPFISSTRIAFSMKKEGHVRLTVFDASGRLVRVLVDAVRDPNRYVEHWDGRDESARRVPAGMYFYVLQAPGWSDSKKMTLAR